MSHRAPQLPFSRHRLDADARRVLEKVRTEGPTSLSKAERHRMFWLGYLDRDGQMTEEGRAFNRAMEDALRIWQVEGGCTACGGVYHPATGHVLSEQAKLCGPCARNFLDWLKKHTRRKWGKLDFYEHAAKKREG